METTIRLFGAFREFSPSGHCVLHVNGNESAAQIKILLAQKLANDGARFDIEALLSKSVLATNERVLGDSEIPGAAVLSILPPVCGG